VRRFLNSDGSTSTAQLVAVSVLSEAQSSMSTSSKWCSQMAMYCRPNAYQSANLIRKKAFRHLKERYIAESMLLSKIIQTFSTPSCTMTTDSITKGMLDWKW